MPKPNTVFKTTPPHSRFTLRMQWRSYTQAHTRLLELVLLPLIVLDALTLLLLIVTGEAASGLAPVIITSLLAAAAILALNRFGHYTVAAIGLLGMIYAGIFAAILALDTPFALLMGTSFLTLITLMASTLLNIQAILLTTLLNVLCIGLLAVLFPQDAPMLLAGPGVLVMTTTGVTLSAAYPRRQMRIQIEGQSAALAESEDRYRSLLKMGFETLLIHENGVVIDASDAVEKMFGYRVHEVVGRALLDFIAPASHRELINRTRHSRSDGAFEALARRKDGSTLRVEILERMAVYRGRSTQVIVIRDLTERIRLEQHRLDLAVERERVTVLQRFISDASHDFRAPLTNLKASLYLVKRLGGDPERQKKHIDVMEYYTLHLEKLLDDLLTMSRLEYAAEELLLDPIDINGLLRELSAKFGTRFPTRAEELRMALTEELPLIWADKSTLGQAFSRILDNAFQYTPENGQIQVRTDVQGQCVRVEIEDTGIGIEAENLPHIFKSFYRADAARGTHHGGTGLGLPIAQKIIEAHDGTIDVSSVPGRGTTISVLLPFVNAPGVQPPQSRPAHPEAALQPAQ